MLIVEVDSFDVDHVDVDHFEVDRVDVDHVDVDHFEVDRVAASRRPFGLLAGAPAFLEFLTFPCKPQKAAIKAARTTGKKRVW